jgi:hypothetical protein
MLALALAIGCGDPEVADSSAPVDRDGDGFEIGEDCDDEEAAIHPGAEERCDGLDDDCDGAVDEEPVDPIALFVDGDADGYGGAEEGAGCTPGVLQATVGGDCDDEDPGANPGAVEICNGGIDDDCDGLSDDDDAPAGTAAWYADTDLDGYGGGAATLSCAGPVGSTEDGSDCNDADPSIHPGALERCDGIDNDCDPFSLETGSVFVGGVRYGSIQDGIDAAPDGGTVKVCNGTWFENLLIDHRHLTIEGSGADVSIVDGSHASSVLVADHGSVVTLRSLTFQHGDTAGSGGGVDAVHAESLTMEDCVVAENHADGDAGGIAGPAYGPTQITGTIVRDNDAAGSGGGALLYNRREWTTDIADSQFLGNQAYAGGGVAFGTARHDGRVSITNSVIDGNRAEAPDGWTYSYGGGIYSECGLALQGVTVSNNQALWGAGVYLRARGGDADDATEIFGNSTYDGGKGGGIYVFGEAAWHHGYIHDNTAAYGGGAYLYLYGESFTDAVVEGNHATVAGGGIWTMSRTEDVWKVHVIGNTSDDVGGGIYVDADPWESYGPPRFTASVVAGNVAATRGGGAFFAVGAESFSTDWGAGVSDNGPDDVVFIYSPDGDSVTYDDFGAAETFVCDTETRTCE